MEDIITEVRVFPKDNLGKTLGFANITLLNKFVIKNLRIVQGEKGIFIGMPSNKKKNGEFIDLFFPITQEARDLITNAILQKYDEVIQHPREMASNL
ncbi:MAG: SpoVG family protein [Spirochaetota bacterium]|nr:SpoVG family protein [Spirochaetota bacterium]